MPLVELGAGHLGEDTADLPPQPHAEDEHVRDVGEAGEDGRVSVEVQVSGGVTRDMVRFPSLEHDRGGSAPEHARERDSNRR